jgi:hypothetical protein
VYAAGGRLECHLDSPGGELGPEDAHRRCAGLVEARPDAVAPHHYVIHDRPPADPGQAAAWAATRVLAEGPGRRA